MVSMNNGAKATDILFAHDVWHFFICGVWHFWMGHMCSRSNSICINMKSGDWW